MKIGLVCPYNMWGGGGVQECVLALRSELEARGHEAKIIAPLPRNFKGTVPAHILTAGMFANVRIFDTQGQISASIDNEKIKTMLDVEQFDVLHFHEPWVPIVSRQILSRSKSANVATSHATFPDNLASKAITNLSNSYTKGLLKYINAYSAVSPSASVYISNFTDKKIKIIPNGIDLHTYTPAPARKKTGKTILYIGRLEKRKGVGYLLEAFQILRQKHPEVTLQIAGEGPLRTRLEEWTKQQGLEGVQFLGYVSEKKKHDLLASADLFCSPALYGESFGIVLLEAMAMRVVTVAGNNVGYSWVMRGEGKSSLVDPTRINAFAKKLETLLYNEKKRAAWLAWAEQYVTQYDYPKVVDQYEALYKQAIKNKRAQDRQRAK